MSLSWQLQKESQSFTFSAFFCFQPALCDVTEDTDASPRSVGVDSLCLFPFRTRRRSNRSVLARGCKTGGWIFSSLDVFYFAEIQGGKKLFWKWDVFGKKKNPSCNSPKVTTRWHPFTYNLHLPHRVAVISFSHFRFPQCSLRFHGDRVSSGF